MLPVSNALPLTYIVNILNTKTYYWAYGNPEANTTIVLIHGFRGDHHGLELIAKELNEFRVIVPDLPGFGLSEPLLQQPIDIYTQWLHQFLLHVSTSSRMVILGHSFGTILVSAAMALDLDLSVERVILLNPLAQVMPRHHPVAQLIIFYYWLSSVLPERLGRNLLESKLIVKIMSMIMIKTKNKKIKKFIYMQHEKYFTTIACLRTIIHTFHIIKNNSVSQYAKKISIPCLIIAAEKDNISSISEQKKLASLSAYINLYVIPKYGHLLHYEAPVTVAKKIRDFCKESRNNA